MHRYPMEQYQPLSVTQQLINFIETIFELIHLAPALLALMKQFSWKRVGLLTRDENRFRRVNCSDIHDLPFGLCIHAVLHVIAGA